LAYGLITDGVSALGMAKPLVNKAIDQDPRLLPRRFHAVLPCHTAVVVMNVQVISAPDGEILWVSGPLPGAVHDLTAARIWGIIRELATAGLITLADKGYQGAGDHVLTPYRGRNKPAAQKDANRAHAQLRSPGERANAQLKTWRILRKLRCCPWRAGQLAKAIHILQARELAG